MLFMPQEVALLWLMSTPFNFVKRPGNRHVSIIQKTSGGAARDTEQAIAGTVHPVGISHALPDLVGPVDEIGKYSVKPSMIPKIIASKIFISLIFVETRNRVKYFLSS